MCKSESARLESTEIVSDSRTIGLPDEIAQIVQRRWKLLGKSLKIDWDAAAQVLVATSPDVPGLVLQGKDIGEIMDKAKLVVPALCEEIE